MKHFSLRAWVSIGQEFDEDTLLVDVGNQVLRSHEALKEQNGKEYWIKKINESLEGEKVPYNSGQHANKRSLGYSSSSIPREDKREQNSANHTLQDRSFTR